MSFYVNDIRWDIEYVDPYDSRLVDRDRYLRVATTDPEMRIIFVSKGLSDEFREDVLIHELTHCVIFSYKLDRYIRGMPEEYLCNFVAEYGRTILYLADKELRKKSDKRLQ